MRRIWWAAMLLLCLGFGGLTNRGRAILCHAGSPSELRLGVVETLFRDFHKSAVAYLTAPLRSLLETHTGLIGRLESTTDPLTLAKQLQEKQLDVAIFHGFEFAWARQKYPQLQPLLVVGNPQPFQAHLIVSTASSFTTPSDLKGKALALPRQSRAHLYLFLERRCVEEGKEPKDYFSRMARPIDVTDALEMVLNNSVQAALVDHAQLEEYRNSQPGNSSRIRVLLQSEVFPTGVIAYRQGNLSDETLQRMRTGMIAAHKSPQGQEMLKLCRMPGFDLPPSDFDKLLQATAKAYPPPSR